MGKSVPDDQEEGREFAKFAAAGAAGELAAPIIGKGISAIASKARAIQAARAGAAPLPPVADVAPPVALHAEGSEGGAVEQAANLEGVRFKDSPLRHVITPPPAVPGKFDSRYPTHKWAPDEDFRSVELVNKGDPGLTTIVHGSTRKPGWWQASRFEDGRPVGDYQSQDATEALRNFPPDQWEPTGWNRRNARVLRAEGSEGGAAEQAAKLSDDPFTGQLDYEPAPVQPDGLAEHGLRMHTWQPFKDDEVFSKWKTTPDFNGVGLVAKDDPSKFVAIHRSTKEPGRWQASSFDADGAVGDSIRDNPDELLQDYSHKWYNPVALKAAGAPVNPEEEP